MLRRTYMFDGIYQSLICFFMGYLLFAPANFVTSSGLGVNDQSRMGVYIACAIIVVVNVYVLLNTYRWDWLMLFLVFISIVLIWFWTGVYTASTLAEQFYKAAPQVYGQLTFWVLSLLTISACLLPRFVAKAYQKLYRPRDIDIIREQVRLGRYDYLDQYEAYVPPNNKVSSAAWSDVSQPSKKPSKDPTPLPDDERPIYPPSIAATGTTRNPRSQNGSDGTEYTGHRLSMDYATGPTQERVRPSFDRMRSSIDRIRPSYEASNDFTSAALLTRVESSHSQQGHGQRPVFQHGKSSLR